MPRYTMTLSLFVCTTLCLIPQATRGADADLLEQARAAAALGNSREAIRLATASIERTPQLAAAYYLRGREHFRSGKIGASVADFDRYVELRPQVAPQQWERGIAYYYAKEFKKGADQFALYQTYHDNDVENSVWRFLCMVPSTGLETARSKMLPIKNDPRPGMMQVYELYRGKLEPQQVLDAVQAGDPPTRQQAGRLFYMHLYLGLYYEALGNQKLAEKFIRLAADRKLADNPHLNRYMWDVARIHQQQIETRQSPTPSKPR